MLSIDLTLIYQIVGFFVLLFILNRLLYAPLRKVLQEREKNIEGTLQDAEAIESDLQGKLEEYDKRIQEAKAKAQEERARIRQEGVDKEREIIEEVRRTTAQEMERMKGEISKGAQDALAQLKEESSGLSREIAEKILGRRVASFLIIIGVPLSASLAFGAGGGDPDGAGGGSIWKVINFVILVVGIYIVWIKVIRGILADRREGIRKAIDEAKMAKDKAEKKSAEYEEKLRLLDSRVEEIFHELREEGEGEKQRIIDEAVRSAEKIKKQAQISADQEIKKANVSIKKEIARLAVEMAGEVLKKEVKPSDQERLIDETLNTIRLQ
ncbi:MAG: hypothetical protein ACE5GF_10010 [Thermodesulfobacteriota bacterium]